MGIYYNTAADDQYISIAKISPLRPDVVFADNPATHTNFISNQWFQFRYRWIYDDNQVGVLGVISDLTIPDPRLTYNNQINVVFFTGHKTVKKIQLLRRVGNGVSDTGADNTEWYIYQTLDKAQQGYSDNSFVIFPFFGTEGITPVSRIDSDKIFESVPYEGRHLEVVNTNQILLGDTTEGNDNVAMNATGIFQYRFNGSYVYADNNDTARFGPYRAGCEPLEGDLMYGTFGDLVTQTYYSYTLAAGDVASPLTMATKFHNVLTGLGIPNTLSPFGPGYEVVSVSPTDLFSLYSIRTNLQRTFKSGAIRNIAIAYYDGKGRCTGAQVIARNVYAKAPLELGLGQTFGPPQFGSAGTAIESIPEVKITITNLPPAFAENYQVLATNSNILEFYQFITIRQTVSDPDFCVIPDPGSWTFEKGDRVKWLYQQFGTGAPTIINDYLVKSYNVTSGVIELYDVDPNTFNADSVFEIYRPNITGFQLFFEFTEVYPIVGGYHTGNTQNQTISQPAIVTILNGDVYEKNQLLEAGPLAIIENLPQPISKQSRDAGTDTVRTVTTNTFKDIPSPYWGKGRVIPETPTQLRQRIGTQIRWSNQLIQNTQVNGLSTWDEGNYDNNLNARYGNITGMRQIGFTLKTIQWSNTATTLLNRLQIANADGSSNILVTDRLLGSTNPSEQEFGTKYPGSVCVHGHNLYFIDTIKGKVLEDAGSGVMPISDLFTRKYWRDKCALVQATPEYDIISGVDFKFGDIYFTVRKPGVTRGGGVEETIYFNQAERAWKYLVDMNTYTGTAKVIESYGWVGQSFFVFMQGQVWQEDALLNGSIPVYLNRFGEQKSLIVETIGMLDADKVKIFLTSQVHSNISPTLVEFWVPANTMYPNGMYTYLKPGNFKYKEGVFYASIKRDWFTKGVPVDSAAGNFQIATGRAIRGHVVRVRLTFTTTEYVKLFSVGTGMIASEKS